MFERLATKLAVRLLSIAALSVESRNLLTAKVLDAVGALPLHDILTVHDGEIRVNGVPLEYDQAVRLREGAKQALANPTLKLVWDQVRYSSFVGGVSTGGSPQDILFYRTAIWNGEQERAWLRVLAGTE